MLWEEPRPLALLRLSVGFLGKLGARPSLGARGLLTYCRVPGMRHPPAHAVGTRLCPPSGSGAGPLLPCRWGLSANANAQVGTGRSHVAVG